MMLCVMLCMMLCVMLLGGMIDFMLFGDIGDGWTDGRMDICTSRVAFATEKEQS